MNATGGVTMLLLSQPFFTSPLDELRQSFERLFEDMAVGAPALTSTRPVPALNVWDSGESVVVEAEVPGMSMDDLEVTAQGNQLSIKGAVRTTTDEKSVFHRRERLAGEFSRFLTLPHEVNADKVEATLRDGVLLITLPKAESARPRKIVVKSV